MTTINQLVYITLFAIFFVFLVSRLPTGTGFDENVHVAFYNFGVYLHNASYILPTTALFRVISWSILIIGASFTIRIFRFILGLIRGNA